MMVPSAVTVASIVKTPDAGEVALSKTVDAVALFLFLLITD
jgi:hypothetical protein